jgi:hypothetical protein
MHDLFGNSSTSCKNSLKPIKRPKGKEKHVILLILSIHDLPTPVK